MSVSIVPDNITYYPPFDEASKTAKITITNTTDEPVTFKVKTTTPKNYCVKPNSDVLKPHQKMDVSIVYLGNDNDLLLSHDPAKPYRCKHKFLIESIPCPYEITDVHKAWASLGTEMKSQLQYKVIRVAFDFVNKNPLVEQVKEEVIVQDTKEEPKIPEVVVPKMVEKPVEIKKPVEVKKAVEVELPAEVEVPTEVEEPTEIEEDVGNKTVETIYKEEMIQEDEKPAAKTAEKATEETKVVESSSSSINPILIVIVAIIAYFAFQMKK